MVEFYFKLVLEKVRTCDRTNKHTKLVPAPYWEEVSNMLAEHGYDLNGDRIKAKG